MHADGTLRKVFKCAVYISEEVARRDQIRLLLMVVDSASNAVLITDGSGLTKDVAAPSRVYRATIDAIWAAAIR